MKVLMVLTSRIDREYARQIGLLEEFAWSNGDRRSLEKLAPVVESELRRFGGPGFAERGRRTGGPLGGWPTSMKRWSRWRSSTSGSAG